MRFQRLFVCWSCGRKMPDGTRLDCSVCEKWLFDGLRIFRVWTQARIAAALTQHDQETGVDWTGENPPRITAAERMRYAESDGIIATLRRELEGVIV